MYYIITLFPQMFNAHELLAFRNRGLQFFIYGLEGQPGDQPEDQPAGQPAYQPIDQTEDQPEDQPEDHPGDQPEEQLEG